VWAVFVSGCFCSGRGLAGSRRGSLRLAGVVPVTLCDRFLSPGALTIQSRRGRRVSLPLPWRYPDGCTVPADAGGAWRYGLRLGLALQLLLWRSDGDPTVILSWTFRLMAARGGGHHRHVSPVRGRVCASYRVVAVGQGCLQSREPPGSGELNVGPPAAMAASFTDRCETGSHARVTTLGIPAYRGVVTIVRACSSIRINTGSLRKERCL